MSQVVEKRSAKPAAVLKDADFNWQDPLDLDGELTEEERMVRESTRGFGLCRGRPDHARTRARRFRLPLGDVGAILIGHAADLHLRH